MGQYGGNGSSGFSSITGGGMDPLTGGASPSTNCFQQKQQPSTSSGSGLPAHTLLHCPCTSYLAFDNAPNVDALRRKLLEFNALLRAQVRSTQTV